MAAENLVHRLAARLEFGRKTEKVATDAIRLVQRMEKDWMTTGRRPSGICGACLILAARMNNFRRTVREVVYVVKVTDMTINKRLDEFKVTPSSNLTVDEFRTIDLTRSHDPPAFYTQRVETNKRKRDEQGENEDQENASASRAASAMPTTERPSSAGDGAANVSQQAPVRRDRDGYAIPEIPIDPTLLAATATALSELTSTPDPEEATPDQPPVKRRRGRPRKDGTIPPPPPSITTPADIAIEEALESEISQYLNDPSTQEHADSYARALASARALALAQQPDAQIPDNSIISESEFADDPEVENCVLLPEEQAIKERIWVHENRDYLRDQQRKLLKQQTEERNGTANVKKRRNRKKRIGEGGEGSQASTPGEAVVNVMKRRGFSRKINYGAIQDMYAERSSRMGSREGSVVDSAASSASVPIAEAIDDAPIAAASGKAGDKAARPLDDEGDDANEDEDGGGDDEDADDDDDDEDEEEVFPGLDADGAPDEDLEAVFGS